MNTVTTEAQITSMPIPPITKYNSTSPVVANSANIAKSASLTNIGTNTTGNFSIELKAPTAEL
ncbi:hypothetical protein [bacterium endosymbiont of Bathymodiolus sp. 5 South]|uniref:hypothetical protein n=1 Tax=bacterium endosymbiont of Bathymodiolus sp. 5 South TaxID=1181670 RepID=UPI001118A731|nr:hypothetical protein [bacterium endosymbiont of Bathymodiolus sp. 5 South]